MELKHGFIEMYGERVCNRNSMGLQEGRLRSGEPLGRIGPPCRCSPTGTCPWQSFHQASSHPGSPTVPCLDVGTHHIVLCLGCSSCLERPFPLDFPITRLSTFYSCRYSNTPITHFTVIICALSVSPSGP